MKTIKLEYLFERTYFKFVQWFVIVARLFCIQNKKVDTAQKPQFLYNCTAVNLYLFITVLQ